MARRLNEEDPDDEKNPVSLPVTRRRKILTSRYLVFGFLTFGILVLAGSLAFTIVSNSGATADPDAEFSVVRRSDWKANPRSDVVLLRTPAQYVVVSDTETEECDKQAQCFAIAHDIQVANMRQGFSDIIYNFLVGGDGTVYEGRGWGVESGTIRIRKVSRLAVGFIGSFTQVAPSKQQLDATQRLIRVGVAYGYIANNYTLMAGIGQKTAEFLITTPDNKLLQEIRTWPHWSPLS